MPPDPLHVLDARFLASAPAPEALPPPALAEIAFGGRSNVGKSSLINTLVQRRKLVRTSSTPGCTRALQLFRVALRSGIGAVAEIDLIDLPGYGFAKVSKKQRRGWGPLIEGYLRERPSLRAVVILFDARRGLEDDDRELLEFVEHVRRTPILVATKIDKLPQSRRAPRLAELKRDAGRRVIGFSAEQDIGRDELWREILRAAGVELAPPSAQPPLRPPATT